jgi:hypothetical protein
MRELKTFFQYKVRNEAYYAEDSETCLATVGPLFMNKGKINENIVWLKF